MPRIVGGSARGRPLKVPQLGTRPTSERAREALFNTVRSLMDLDGARVLDLFAGSGAVGLEALSLGARTAVLVERDRRACAVIEDNIAAVGLPGAVLRSESAAGYLGALADQAPDAPFDLVFADPPYALGQDELTHLLGLATRPQTLAPDGLIVVERAARAPEPSWPPGTIGLKSRRYSEAVLWYGRREQTPA